MATTLPTDPSTVTQDTNKYVDEAIASMQNTLAASAKLHAATQVFTAAQNAQQMATGAVQKALNIQIR